MRQPAMTAEARRSGLEVLRAVLRRRHRGVDFAFVEIEWDDRRRDTGAGEVSGSLTAPQNPGARLDRVDVTTPPAGASDHDGVDEPGEDLAAGIAGEG